MDPLSITTGCVTLVATITKLTVQINGFVREIRGARSDLDAVSRELHSLMTVLDMLAHDAGDTARSAFPPSLAQQVTGIVKNCGGVVSQIEASLEKHGGESARLKKGVQWSWGGKSDMEQLRSSLEAHKSALDIALQMVEMSIMRDIKADTQEIRDDTAAIPGIKEDTTRILVEIARLQAKLPKNVELQGLEGHGLSGFMLQRYLDNLTTYAETTYDASDGEPEEETAHSTPRAVAEQEEIEHHLEHFNFWQDNTQELPKNITDRLFEDPDKESSLVYTIPKAPGTIEDVVSVDRVEVNHVAIAKAFDRRSKLSLEEYESLTHELVRNLDTIGDVSQIRDLLRRGANPNGLESSPRRTVQNTPIGTVANNPRCLAVLLEYGVDISVEMKDNLSLPRSETEHPIPASISNSTDPALRGVAALFIKTYSRLLPTLKVPVTSLNVPVTALKVPVTALGIAARNGNLQAVKMLLLAGANVNGPEHGTSPIHAFLTSPIHDIISTAQRAGDRIGILSLLAAHGANVDETGGRWFTALQFVCSIPETHVTAYSIKLVVEQLLSYGAKPNIHGGLYGSAIHAAVTVLNFNTVQLLLQHDADPGLRATCTFIGRSILFHTRRTRCEEVTPSELLDKLWLAYSKSGRSETLKIRKLLEGAIRRRSSSNV